MILTDTASLLLLLCPLAYSEVDLTPIAVTCTVDTAAEIFKSAVYIHLVSNHDPDVVFGLQVPSADAAQRTYNVQLRLLQDYGLRNAESIASTVRDAVSLVDPFTLPVYYLNTGITGGHILSELGILNCDNVIARASQFLNDEQREFQYLDPTQLESYVQADVSAGIDFLDTFPYNLEEHERNWQRIADLFHIAYSNYGS